MRNILTPEKITAHKKKVILYVLYNYNGRRKSIVHNSSCKAITHSWNDSTLHSPLRGSCVICHFQLSLRNIL